MTAVSGSGSRGAVTVGIDIGTTSVKGLAVSGDGQVVGRARVPHRVIVEAADRLEHDARKAWRTGPVKAFRAVSDEAAAAGFEVAGVCVSSMVPSLTAVDKRGVPLTAGLLYGDVRGRNAPEDKSIMMRDAEGFLRWAVEQAPGAAGYWPAQAVATMAIGGVPAIDSAMTASLGALHTWGKWQEEEINKLGANLSQMAEVVPMGEAAGRIPGTDIAVAGGSIDALCDQLVAGASNTGDVLVVIGATLVVWIVIDEWVEVPGLWTVPHTVPDRFLIGGPSNAGALFVDWARGVLNGLKRHGSGEQQLRSTDQYGVPIWLPYLRGERTPYNDPELRSSLYGLDITLGSAGMERAAYEASGFVVRRMLDMAGVTPRRVVASGGGSRVVPWMAAMADAVRAPVDSVAVPEGAALGASFLARVAAGLEKDIGDAERWARVGRRTEPDPAWVDATHERYEKFLELSPRFDPGAPV